VNFFNKEKSMITCGQPGDQLALRQFLALSTGKNYLGVATWQVFLALLHPLIWPHWRRLICQWQFAYAVMQKMYFIKFSSMSSASRDAN